ncbi:MAG: hypothetical protein KIS87_01945 [Phycisphaeraceae bacterium]|nr:hypothetical protein [Phycisphaeraceae bacterium]
MATPNARKGKGTNAKARSASPAASSSTLPLKIGITIAIVGGMSGVLFVLVGTKGLLAVPALALAFGLMLLVYRAVVGWAERRKSKPFERRLRDAAAVTPRVGADAARRARLDDIRKRFEEGVEVFRQNGKDLYSVPWYLLVGEPGSGKTEAIRHSGVGFPPGLQNTLQGTGGTLNMNWWFTSQAVILDTAGRLIFEDVEPGTGSEWTEFLKLLRTARPNCPINGLLLVLPADSLIKDSPEEIAHKAERIATQLNVIQRALGVRFPVFLLITKADLINGFREFFDSIKDPALQHQILGWSNPSPLGEPFDPNSIETLLSDLRAWMRRRRLGLLLDPVHTEDASARRFDQVDALYAFPDALVQLAPRLRRYLEAIFVSGVWGEPPFLRGVYFTSAMRDGSALDADLAEALGVPVDRLPEGRVWKKDRSYFLRELFLRKVFRERGLVTRATDVQRQQRTRKAMVLGSGLAAAVIAIGATWFAGQQFKASIDGHQRLWSAIRREFVPESDRAPVSLIAERIGGRQGFVYEGDRELRLGPVETTIAAFPVDVRPWVEDAVRIPAVFAPIAGGFGDLDAMRRRAFAAVVEIGVVRPIVSAARARLARDRADTWSDASTAALVELSRMEVAHARGGLWGDGPNLAVLMRYALLGDDEGAERASRAAPALFGGLEWLYKAEGGGAAWPPPSLGCGTPEGLRALGHGANEFVRFWQTRADTGGIGEIEALVRALADLNAAERDLIAADAVIRAATVSEYDRAAADWSALAVRHSAAAADVERSLNALGVTGTDRLQPRVDAAARELREHALRAFVLLESEFGDVPALASIKGVVASGRESVVSESERRVRAIVRDLAQLGDRQLERGGDGQAAFLRRKEAVEGVRRLLTAVGSEADDDLRARLAAIDRGVAEARSTIAAASTGEMESGLFSLVEAAGRRQRHAAVQGFLSSVRGGAPRLVEFVAHGAGEFDPMARPDVPLTLLNGGRFDERFHPASAARLFETVGVVGALVKSDGGLLLDGEVMTLQAQELSEEASRYAAEYVEYWAGVVPGELKPAFRGHVSWAGVQSALASLATDAVCDAAEAAWRAVESALSVLPSWVEEAVGARARDTVARAVAERESLAGAEARRRADAALRAWRALGEDPSRARETVLAMEPGEFSRALMVENAHRSGGYWFGVFKGALRALAESSRGSAQASIDTLIAARGIPLCRDEARTLDVARFADAARASREVRAALAAMPPDGQPGRTIGEGARTNDQSIDAELTRLRGGVSVPGPGGLAWFERIEMVLAALHDDEDPLEFDVIALPAELHGDAAVFSRFGVWELGIPLRGADGRTTRFPVSPAQPVPAVRGIASPGPAPLEIRYFQNEDDDAPVVATATLDAPWTALAALLVWGGEPIRGGDLAGVWRVAVPARRASDGAIVRCWICLRPNRAIPGPDRWPSSEDWPH